MKHPNELDVVTAEDALLAEAEALGPAHVAALREQKKRQVGKISTS